MNSLLRGLQRLVLVLMTLLALLQLGDELGLLLDHFTWTAMGYSLKAQPLAVLNLLALPVLWPRPPRRPAASGPSRRESAPHGPTPAAPPPAARP